MSDYCEYPAFFSEAYRTARKEHKCIECGSKIFPGEKYYSYAGKWDDGLDSGKQHLLCLELCTTLNGYRHGKLKGSPERDCWVYFGGLFPEWNERFDYGEEKSEWDKACRNLMAQIKLRIRKEKRALAALNAVKEKE